MPTLAQRPNWRARRVVGTAFTPPSGFIVDEVANELALASHPDVLWYPDLTSWATVEPDMSFELGFYGYDTTVWPKLFFTTAPEFGDIPVMRFESSSITPDTIAPNNTLGIAVFFKWLYEGTKQNFRGSSMQSVAPIVECWFRYSIMAESSVWDGFNETGMKIPGLENDADWGTVMHHSAPADVARNPPYNPATQKIDFETYYHGVDTNPDTFGTNWLPDGLLMEPGVWNTIEQHVIMNTGTPGGPANADGTVELWLNDVFQPDASFYNVRLWNIPVGKVREINHVYGLIYHGGVGFWPVVPIHYRLTGLAMATRRIGKPKVV